ncbi:MAG TPA: hypothetical protein VGM24_04385, partial [Puia sp.]
MKNLLLVLFLIPVSFYPQAQDIRGSWQGTLEAGAQKLKVIFHIKSDSLSGYRSDFDSPDQGALGIPCSETRVKADSVEMLIKVINGGYRGKWDGKNSISGYYFQNGARFPLDLSRAPDKPAALVRPQEPKPP